MDRASTEELFVLYSSSDDGMRRQKRHCTSAHCCKHVRCFVEMRTMMSNLAKGVGLSEQLGLFKVPLRTSSLLCPGCTEVCMELMDVSVYRPRSATVVCRVPED
jgi:hypothetical protein